MFAELVASLAPVIVGIAVGWLVTEVSALGIGLIATWATVHLFFERVHDAVLDFFTRRGQR
jgi:hypothetical protein